jgi:hypothetical protein
MYRERECKRWPRLKRVDKENDRKLLLVQENYHINYKAFVLVRTEFLVVCRSVCVCVLSLNFFICLFAKAATAMALASLLNFGEQF